MSPLATSGVVLFCIFGCALLGVILRTRFPDQHLTADTRDLVKLVMGTVGTMTGMVLGLLVASAKSTFDSQRGGVAQLATNVVLLDRTLAHYGPEAGGVRATLRDSVNDMIHRMWPEEAAARVTDHDGHYDDLYDQVLALQPKTDAQRATQAQALKVMHDTAQMRWHLYTQRGNSVPPIFLVLMVAWLSLTFASYGLFAQRHGTTLAVLLLGSFVVSSAVFLILELDNSFGGIIHISSLPMTNAVSQLGR
ncbi:MAG: hypothetical protein U0804_20525 [Gemmataceae bacterium]